MGIVNDEYADASFIYLSISWSAHWYLSVKVVILNMLLAYLIHRQETMSQSLMEVATTR